MPDDKTGRVRDQILDEATRLFAAHGFGATSIQADAEAVGIRKPSLLYHFGSKELLRSNASSRVGTSCFPVCWSRPRKKTASTA